jgi:hypothetical protein
MNPEARRIIQLARQARTPTVADKRRVRAAVALGVAAAAVAVPASAAAGASAKAAGAAGAFGVFTGLRGIVSVVAIASTSVGAGAYFWEHAHAARPSEGPAPVSLAPLPPVAPQPVPVSAPAVVTPAPVATAEHPSEARGRARVSPLDPLAAELTLLQSAKQAWREGRPQAALELAQKHAQLYPRSQLASERDALKVFALCGLGRTSDARDLGASLLAREPASPFRASIEQSCAMLPPK